MWTIYALVFANVIWFVESQTDVVDVNDLYRLVQNRNKDRLETGWLINQLQRLEEKTDTREISVNKKTDAINRRLDLLENAIADIRKSQQGEAMNANPNQQKDGSNTLDNIQNQLTIMRQSFQNEKKFVRKLKSQLLTTGANIPGIMCVQSGQTERRNHDNTEQLTNEYKTLTKLETFVRENMKCLSSRQNFTEESLVKVRKDIEVLETRVEKLSEKQTTSVQRNQDETMCELSMKTWKHK